MSVAINAAVALPLAVGHGQRADRRSGYAPARTVDTLGARLTSQTAAGRPSIVVAASGGGTRAAVYTAVALEGIAQIDRARDVVLLSGVSVAAFQPLFRQRTTGDDTAPGAATPLGDKPWEEYVSVVSARTFRTCSKAWASCACGHHLLVRCCKRASRIARSPTSAHVRRAQGTHAHPQLRRQRSPYEDSQLMAGASPVAQHAGCVEVARPYANLAGGRLVFTNLKN